MLKDTMELVGVWQTDNHQDSEERPPPEKDVHGKKRKKKKAPAKFIAHYDKMTYTKRNAGTEGVAWGTVSAGGQQRENQRSKERGRRAEKTKLLRGSADVGGPGLV